MHMIIRDDSALLFYRLLMKMSEIYELLLSFYFEQVYGIDGL